MYINISKPCSQFSHALPFFATFRFSIASAMSHSLHSSAFNTPRLVLKKVLAKSQHEGDGAVVRRGIGRYIYSLRHFINHLSIIPNLLFHFLFFFSVRTELKNLDPFLMLDHFSGTYNTVILFVFVWNLFQWSLLWLTSLCPLSVVNVTQYYIALHYYNFNITLRRWLCSLASGWISRSPTQRFWNCHLHVRGIVSCIYLSLN